jgi:hypothetical protein
MALIKAWSANIAGPGPTGVDVLYSDDESHSTGAVYNTHERSSVNGSPVLTNYGGPRWRLYLDLNHRPSLIWQMAIIRSGVAGGLPAPARTWDGGTVNGLDLTGGELRIRMSTARDFYLPQRTQLLLHAQWYDPNRFYGHGTTYNAVFVPKNRPTFDQALGAPPPGKRDPSGFVILPQGFVDYTFKYDPSELQDLAARPDRMFPGFYSPIPDRQEVMKLPLLNTLIIFHCPDEGSSTVVGTNFGEVIPPRYQPPDDWNAPGTPGIWYISLLELWVDPLLNPGAVSVA